MLKYILIILCSLFFINLNAQVYIAKHLRGEIFVGPENVKQLGEGIRQMYLDEFNVIVDQLNEELFDAELALQGTRKKRIKYSINTTIEKIKKDLDNIKLLQSAWLNFTFDKYLEKGAQFCSSQTDEYTDVKILIEEERSSHFSLVEYIELLEATKSSTKWVKRKADKNCLSANPEDCLVWCLIEVKCPYFMTIDGNEITFCDDTKVGDFEKSLLKNQLTNTWEIELDKPLELIKAKDQVSLEFVPLTKLERCN